QVCRTRLMEASHEISIWKFLASPAILSLDRHHDLGRNPPIPSRFLSRETTQHCALVVTAARRAKSAFHQRRHEPVRADLPWTAETFMDSGACGRHPEMHPRRRQT